MRDVTLSTELNAIVRAAPPSTSSLPTCDRENSFHHPVKQCFSAETSELRPRRRPARALRCAVRGSFLARNLYLRAEHERESWMSRWNTAVPELNSEEIMIRWSLGPRIADEPSS